MQKASESGRSCHKGCKNLVEGAGGVRRIFVSLKVGVKPSIQHLYL